MGALPKKKLCWNCEGNVDVINNNCPYCGVYLHVNSDEKEEFWNPVYSLNELDDEENDKIDSIEQDSSIPEEQSSKKSFFIFNPEKAQEENAAPSFFAYFFRSLKALLPVKDIQKRTSTIPPTVAPPQNDILSLLFLMSGSISFLFGLIILIFAQNGVFTLQWKAYYGYYFLAFSLPFISFGLFCLRKVEK